MAQEIRTLEMEVITPLMMIVGEVIIEILVMVEVVIETLVRVEILTETMVVMEEEGVQVLHMILQEVLQQEILVVEVEALDLLVHTWI